jgi:hypothetical protein
VGPRDFSSHEISGCDDPCGGSAMIYSTIFECQKALDALDLHSTPYNANYIDDLYSDYSCSDDDFFPETKGAIGKSRSSSSGDSAIIGSGNIIDSDFIVDSGIHTVRMTSTPSLVAKSRMPHSHRHACSA